MGVKKQENTSKSSKTLILVSTWANCVDLLPKTCAIRNLYVWAGHKRRAHGRHWLNRNSKKVLSQHFSLAIWWCKSKANYSVYFGKKLQENMYLNAFCGQFWKFSKHRIYKSGNYYQQSIDSTTITNPRIFHLYLYSSFSTIPFPPLLCCAMAFA